MFVTHNLSLQDALKIIRVIQGELEKQRKDAAVAIADTHGELIAFIRTDNCHVSVVNIAINKAYTAARECRESKAVGEAARREGFPLTNYGELRFTGWAGGIPITFKERVVGAVGVSGLSEEEDEHLAKMGAASLSL